MTKNKRFTLKNNILKDEYCIFDDEYEYAFVPSENKTALMSIVEVLNQLNDEKEHLKTLLNEISDKNNEIWLEDGRIIRLTKVFKGEYVK